MRISALDGQTLECFPVMASGSEFMRKLRRFGLILGQMQIVMVDV